MRFRFLRFFPPIAVVAATCAVAAAPAGATFAGKPGEIAVEGWPGLGPTFALFTRKGELAGTFGPTGGRGGELAWSPDGGKLASVVYGSVTSYVVVQGFPSGTSLGGAAFPAYGIQGAPTFAPDGTRIAYSFYDDDGEDPDLTGIYAQTIGDTSSAARLTASWGQRLAWSPDGSTILASNGSGIVAVRADGGGEHVVVPGDAGSAPGITGLDWAPDGRHFAFSSTVAGNSDVYAAEADGSRVRRLTTSPADDRAPSWSPDGKAIVFVTTRDGAPAHSELYIVRPGQAERRLTTSTPDPQALPSYPDFRLPAWRPLPR